MVHHDFHLTGSCNGYFNRCQKVWDDFIVRLKEGKFGQDIAATVELIILVDRKNYT